MTGGRKWLLMVDSCSAEEPPNRYFGRLDRALVAWSHYPDHFKRFGWVKNMQTGEVFLKDGRIVDVGRMESVLEEELPS